jgi:hypothetical protein
LPGRGRRAWPRLTRGGSTRATHQCMASARPVTASTGVAGHARSGCHVLARPAPDRHPPGLRTRKMRMAARGQECRSVEAPGPEPSWRRARGDPARNLSRAAASAACCLPPVARSRWAGRAAGPGAGQGSRRSARAWCGSRHGRGFDTAALSAAVGEHVGRRAARRVGAAANLGEAPGATPSFGAGNKPGQQVALVTTGQAGRRTRSSWREQLHTPLDWY